MSETIHRLREEISALSVELLTHLNQRTARVLEIAKEKRRLSLPTRDPYRESQLLDHLVQSNQGPLDAATVRTLFRQIFDASVMLQDRSGQQKLCVSAAHGAKVSVSVRGHVIGDGRPIYIAGPCAVESAEQIEQAAAGLAAMGVRFFRGGTFKLRTSPHTFQGLGEPGLKLLADACRRHQLVSISEATSPHNLEVVARYVDIIQIGTRNMYNYDLLRAAGQTGMPVLLKRGLSATLDEWLHAAEHIAIAGSERIILCERGIRTFARETRGTLDLSIVPLAQKASRLPVIVDVSHAAGRRDILSDLACAAFAVGAAAVMIEVHPDPDLAQSDAEQQLNLADFAQLQRFVRSRLRANLEALACDEVPTTTARTA
jgi:3-deoxy-7-phosphoheptulonate synthase/chorismate mutase